MTGDLPPPDYVPVSGVSDAGVGTVLKLLREHPHSPALGSLWHARQPLPPNWHVPRWVLVLAAAAGFSARQVGYGEAHPAVVERTVRHWFAWAVCHREDILAVWDLGGAIAVETLLRGETGDVPSMAPPELFSPRPGR